MENFFIRFTMASPIAFGHRKPFTPLMFDGLLTWMIKGDAKSAELPDVPLPIEQSGENRYFHASAWELKTPRFGTFCWVKTNPEHWAKRELKSPKMLEIISYIATPEVTFYARGSMKDIIAILNRTENIALGSKRLAGWGRVKGIQAGVTSTDYSVWDRHGRPARPIPTAEIAPEKIAGNGVVLMPYKPPYWTGEKVPCLVPSLERWWPGINADNTKVLEEQLKQKLAG